MRLRRPCEHVDDQYPEGHYDKHLFPTAFSGYPTCPGGEFLADDTLVLSLEDAERRIAEVIDGWAPDLNDHALERFTAEILDALAVREGDR